MIYSMSRLKEMFYKEINQDLKEEADMFEDGLGEEDFCLCVEVDGTLVIRTWDKSWKDAARREVKNEE